VGANEHPIIMTPCSFGEDSDREQVEEEEGDADGRNGRYSAESLRGYD
jgi:hypothetical protein